ncbi:MAG: PadR family transcriptional regulator [Chloroflexi bacterium]|nr:PadR family transcriptional regulator [Chloroflexota bacterium]
MDHTLLVLGLLKLQEMHGYQLSDLIDRRLKYLTDLKKPTLYHLLAKLEAAGRVTKSVSREGNRPERHTYRLTRAGEEQFTQLLEQNLRDAHAAYFNDDIGLLFLSEIAPADARAYLERKRAGVDAHIAEIAGGLAAHQPHTPAYYTLRHHALHLQTERAWLDELLAQMKRRTARQNVLECLDAAEASPRKRVTRKRTGYKKI